MYKIDFETLRKHIQEAGRLGREASAKVPDSGTCNLDTVVLYNLGRFREDTFRKQFISGYKPEPGCWALSFNFGGQADKNTVGVETARDYLQSQGIKCYIHYQMD